MRWHNLTFRCLILVLVISLGFTYFLYKQGAESWCKTKELAKEVNELLVTIPCIINGHKRIDCFQDRENSEIYLPFYSFVQKYFDVTGQVVKGEDQDVFEWWHSYAKVHPPPHTYSPSGVFGPFAAYNVEGRERVRCISPINGVPMSTQWDPVPYYYPVQIAQFGLEHYSKNITNTPPLFIPISYLEENWVLEDTKSQKISTVLDKNGQENIEIKSEDSNLAVEVNLQYLHSKLKLNYSTHNFNVLQFDAKFEDNSGYTVAVRRLDTDTVYQIHFIPKHLEECVKLVADTNELIYGMGDEEWKDWRQISRNLLTDLNRGLGAANGVKGKKKHKHQAKVTASLLVVQSVTFHGSVTLRNLGLTTSNHYQSFMQAATWFMHTQNKRGGWSVPVQRSLADGQLQLKPDWFSAMAQGHAISLLVRAYYRTKDKEYLESARKATALFQVEAKLGGVRNTLLGTPWFEEYPTTPGTFVLNGFIYSLVGLYDLAYVETELGNRNSTAEMLYVEGLKSLKLLLPFYDTGSGSHYDLRHFSLPANPPNLARWDYHTVHVYQLMWLSVIEKNDELFAKFAERWKAYTFGERAKHN